MAKRKNLDVEKWASGLTAEQMRPLLAELVDFAHEADYVGLGDMAPYWDGNGDPLIEGQRIWADEL